MIDYNKFEPVTLEPSAFGAHIVGSSDYGSSYLDASDFLAAMWLTNLHRTQTEEDICEAYKFAKWFLKTKEKYKESEAAE